MMNKSDTLILAHYYTTPEVQQMADFVGDSLDLSLKARDAKAKRIVFAGVRFMAETAKILNPDAEVILPDERSTCSLVIGTDIHALRAWRLYHPDHVHVAYINSSVEHKALADWIVTSRNVQDIVEHLHAQGKKVMFSPDYNMGKYLNHLHGWKMPVWRAVCEVHEKFNLDALNAEVDKLIGPNSGMGCFVNHPVLIAHPESTLAVLERADFVGSTSEMLKYVENFRHHDTIFVATEDGILYNMRQSRPDLDIRQAPTYKGCQCNQCPYMKYNDVYRVEDAVNGNGLVIDYIPDDLAERALVPIKKMLEFDK